MSDVNPANVAHAALLEVGRPDLAELVQFLADADGGWYLEPIDDGDELQPADLELLERAERIALEAMRR